MHFAIVEDLNTDINILTGLIREDCAAHGDPAEFSTWHSAEDFLAGFRPGLYSAVFLDIMLGEGMTGIEAARKVRELDEEIPVIFTTTERDFALESYDVHALGYLVKPVQPEKLAWCLKRLRDTFAAPEFVEVLGSETAGRMRTSRRILLDDIMDTDSSRRGCVIHTPDGDVMTPQPHTELMRLLPQTGRFCEYARGVCVNFSWVQTVDAEGKIIMKDGRTLFCSRRRIKDTLEAFRAYRFSVMRAGS